MAKTSIKYEKLTEIIGSIGSGPVDDRDENYSSYCHLKAWGNARAFEETFRAEEAKKLAQERTTAFSLAACFMCAISEKYRAPGADDETVKFRAQERVVERYEFNYDRLEKGAISIEGLQAETAALLHGDKITAPFDRQNKPVEAWNNDKAARQFKS